MATYRTEIDSPRSPGEVFEYLATFSNARDWDPSVAEAEPLSAGRAEVGSVYRLGVRTAGRVVPLDYEVVALDRPHRVVLEARRGRAGLVGHHHGGTAVLGVPCALCRRAARPRAAPRCGSAHRQCLWEDG